MPNIGFWAVAGAGAAGAGAYELIETQLISSTVGSVTFNSIPSTYKHLELRFAILAGSSGGAPSVQLNGVTTSSYSKHGLFGNSNSVGSTGNFNQTNMTLGASNVGAHTTYPLVGIASFADYASSSKNKTMRSVTGISQTNSTNSQVDLFSGSFYSTSVISSILIGSGGGNFVSGSRFSLYGIKG